MNTEDLLEQYSCGPVKFSGRDDALYERHLMFDQVAPTTKATAREQFEAAARSVRDVLSQRWIKTEQTYQQRNAKRVYYLSMEYLIGRALANNITNLRLEPVLEHFEELHKLNPLEVIEAGTGRWAGQWWTRAAGRLFPRFHGDARPARHGLRIAL